MRLKYLLILFCFSLVAGQALATHIVGGELYYTYLGNDPLIPGNKRYEIKMKIYRDCFNGQAGFDDPAPVGIFNSSNSLITTISLPKVSQANIANIINNPCLIPPSNICYEYAYYSTIVSLAPAVGGYQLAYQRCCRNGSISNILNPGNFGATYHATIPGGTNASNSSPEFSTLPPTFICANNPFEFNHSATDADGDSLVYSLATPFVGASSITPAPSSPSPPPYSNVSWVSPYSLTNMLGYNTSTGAPLTIDSTTGVMYAIPNNTGQFLYGVKVQEYRNGVLIGETKREFQANIIICNYLINQPLVYDSTLCGTLTALIANNSSIDSSGITIVSTSFWDFGVTTSTSDTLRTFSNINPPNVSFTYPDTGCYNVTLTVTSVSTPSCAKTKTFRICTFPLFDTNFTDSVGSCTNTVYFKDASTTINNNTNYWYWTFGDGTFSYSKNPVHTYAVAGIYTVKLVSKTADGCDDFKIKVINVAPLPVASFTVLACHNTVANFTNTSTIGSGTITVWSWDFGDGHLSTAQNPTNIYASTGTFPVTLIVTSAIGCKDTIVQNVTVHPLPVPDFSSTVACHHDQTVFADLSTIAAATISGWNWDFGDGGTSLLQNPNHLYASAGTFDVSLIAISAVGCRDTIVKQVLVNPLPPANAGPDTSICFGQSTQLDASGGATYLWTPNTSISNPNVPDPVVNPVTTTSYTVLVTDTNSCQKTDVVKVTILLLPLTNAGPDLWLCPGDSIQLQGSGGLIFDWTPGATLDDSTIATPDAGPSASITYTLISTDNFGCSDTDYVWVEVDGEVPTNAGSDTSICIGQSTFIGGDPTAPAGSIYAWIPSFSLDDATLSNPMATPGATTLYYVYTQNDTCHGKDSMVVTVLPLPDVEASADRDTLYEGESTNLHTIANDGNIYLWSPATTLNDPNVLSPIATPPSSTIYYLMVTDVNGCVNIDSIMVHVKNISCTEPAVFIPNTFTPNNDNNNDMLYVRGNMIEELYFVVYNRWGQKVFETKDKLRGWDGYYKGKLVEAGVFAYYFEVKCFNGESYFKKGNVTLFR